MGLLVLGRRLLPLTRATATPAHHERTDYSRPPGPIQSSYITTSASASSGRVSDVALHVQPVEHSALSDVGQAVFNPLFDALILLVLSLVLRKRAPKLSLALRPWRSACSSSSRARGGEPTMSRSRIPTLDDHRAGRHVRRGHHAGGTTTGWPWRRRGLRRIDEAVERVLTTSDLLRTNRGASRSIERDLVGAQAGEAEPESRLIVRQLVAWGIDPARLVADEVSRNAHRTRSNPCALHASAAGRATCS